MAYSEYTFFYDAVEELPVKVIAVIPARGGSKGIPRKNLRPLAGKPMIYYAIDACLKSKQLTQVIVTTDDPEIALFAGRFGARVVMRPASLAEDATTLDPVIQHAVQEIESLDKLEFDLIVSVQPTSPLIRSSDIERCLDIFRNDKSVDSVLSVADDRHLCWTLENGKAVKNYKERVNRQKLPANYRETGAIIACRRAQLITGSRIGNEVALLEMPQDRSFDIDTLADFYLCESILTRKTVVFVVVGYPEVGMGHAYRATLLAHELVKHDIHFVCDESSQLAAQYIASQNYKVQLTQSAKFLETLKSLNPDLVINDVLDTSRNYVRAIKSLGCHVINFEDLGEGALEADLVINALYPQKIPSDHVVVGSDYFCLRDEFLYAPEYSLSSDVKRVLITFGGVDEGNLSHRTLNIVADLCMGRGIHIDIVLGPGYKHMSSLSDIAARYPKDTVNIIRNTARISDFMMKADVAITSGGRTVLELAATKTPMIVICQNKRETTHTVASSANGIINLGLRCDVSDNQILEAFQMLVDDSELRSTIQEKLASLQLMDGKRRVIQRIEQMLV